VAGGLTLYEACALGTPVVAVPVVPGQRPALAAAASAGAVVRVAARYEHHVPVEVAAAVTAVISTPALASGLGRRARRLVDGQGSVRVAARLRVLCAPTRQGAWPHAA
jgi:spore coat polysaccharide biosynthesis predicted glycosyltransferase SpsG